MADKNLLDVFKSDSDGHSDDNELDTVKPFFFAGIFFLIVFESPGLSHKPVTDIHFYYF